MLDRCVGACAQRVWMWTWVWTWESARLWHKGGAGCVGLEGVTPVVAAPASCLESRADGLRLVLGLDLFTSVDARAAWSRVDIAAFKRSAREVMASSGAALPHAAVPNPTEVPLRYSRQ